MNNFEFVKEEEKYVLSEENFTYIDNEEVDGLDLDLVLKLLNEAGEKVYFDYEYYSDPCDECGKGVCPDKKHYRFLEYHFYVFTKGGKYIISNISTEFENTSYTALVKENKIDNSYIVSVLLCEECKTYNIAVEQCEM